MWASLARDYLAIMASSVSSEHAFSSAGITISKCRNRLKPDIVEALQFMKCLYRRELLFREEPSAAQEVEVDMDLEDKINTQEGWDDLIPDLPDDEGFQDIDDDEAFVQSLQ